SSATRSTTRAPTSGAGAPRRASGASTSCRSAARRARRSPTSSARRSERRDEPWMNPVRVVPHRESWKDEFESEAVRVRDALGAALERLHHIGSTAIPGIHAKPVIDMLAEVETLDAVDAARTKMEALGYEAMGEFGIPGRRYFRKDTAGARTHQIHAFVVGSP